MFEKKLTTMGEAQNQRRDNDIKGLEGRIDKIATDTGGGDGGQVRERERETTRRRQGGIPPT